MPTYLSSGYFPSAQQTFPMSQTLAGGQPGGLAAFLTNPGFLQLISGLGAGLMRTGARRGPRGERLEGESPLADMVAQFPQQLQQQQMIAAQMQREQASAEREQETMRQKQAMWKGISQMPGLSPSMQALSGLAVQNPMAAEGIADNMVSEIIQSQRQPSQIDLQRQALRQRELDIREQGMQMGRPPTGYRLGQGGEFVRVPGLPEEYYSRAAPQSVSVTNVMPPQESEFLKASSKEAGQAIGSDYAKMQTEARKSYGLGYRAGRIEKLLQGISTGPATPAIMKGQGISRKLFLGRSLRISTGPATPAIMKGQGYIEEALPGTQFKNLGKLQAAQSDLNQMTLEIKGALEFPSNAFSDADREFLAKIPPGLETSEQGRSLIIESAKRTAKRQQESARIAREYKKANNGVIDEGVYDILQQYADSNPLFEDLQSSIPELSETPSGGVATPRTKEEFEALPSGTEFINPATGQRMRKR